MQVFLKPGGHLPLYKLAGHEVLRKPSEQIEGKVAHSRSTFIGTVGDLIQNLIVLESPFGSAGI